eukprot:1689802-Prymnesium_polylepis.1
MLSASLRAQHDEHTLRLRAAVGELLDDPLGELSAPRKSPPPRHWCSTEARPSIANTADPKGVWMGDLKCVECAACSSTGEVEGVRHGRLRTPNTALAVLMLGHRRRLLLETVATHVIRPSADAGHNPTFFAYLENGTMNT